jgi:Xaa-Pro aminopeptidase
MPDSTATAPASATRADRAVAGLSERGLDALLVGHPVNLRYLTGFTGSNGLAVLAPDRRVFLTDFRYVSQAAEEVPDFERVRCEQELVKDLEDQLPPGELRLGFDDEHTSVKGLEHLRDALPERVKLVPAGGLVEDLRLVKDAGEVARIRAALELAERALEATLARGLVGRTEHEVAVDLEHEMRRLGATAPSFPSIIASGAHGALPHAQPRDVAIAAGVLVTIDMGAQLDGYCSDRTRTLATGEVSDDEREVYELVLRAEEAGVAAVAAGRGGKEVDAVARELIEEAGYGEHFGHGLGHGVGMEIHEAPRLARTSTATLGAGNVVTVEPGVYLPDRFGVRIEDMVLVTEEGAEVLAPFDKSLTVVS